MKPTATPFVELNKDISNPERGFITEFDILEPSTLLARKNRTFGPVSSGAENLGANGNTLAYSKLEIPDKVDDFFISRLEEGFNRVREDGVKVILHSNFEGVPLATIIALRPVLWQNQDLIFLWQVETGDYSVKITWRQKIKQAREERQIINTLYSVLPERAIAVSSPEAKQEIFRNVFSKNKFPPDYYSGGSMMLWQRDTEEMTGLYQACSTESEPGPIVGDIACAYDCQTAAHQLKKKHFTYIAPAKDAWQSGGCQKNIKAYLGYRFVLREFQHSLHSSDERTINISISIENVGFAPPFYKRPIYLVLTKKGQGEHPGTRRDILISSAEPRFWEGGKEYTTTEKLLIPNTTPTGVYTLSLWLPDPSPRLQDDPRYAIRLANVGTWNEKYGLNVISNGFVVGAPETPPQE